MEHGPAGPGGLARCFDAIERFLDGAAEELALGAADAQQFHAFEEEGAVLRVEHAEAAVDLERVHIGIRRVEVRTIGAFERDGSARITQIHAQPGAGIRRRGRI